MPMECTISGSPSVDDQHLWRDGSMRRLRSEHCAVAYFDWPAETKGQTRREVTDTCAGPRLINEDIACRLPEWQPAQVNTGVALGTEDEIGVDWRMYLESLAKASYDDFDDDLTEEDFDFNARLTPPPVTKWRIKVKLRFIGRQSPRIHIDPELAFDPELDEENNA